MNRLLRTGQRLLDLGLRRLRRPADRNLVVADAEHGVLLADQAQHRLAAEAHATVGKHRLILHVGKDAEAVDRHVARSDDAGEPRVRGVQRREIAEGEARLGVRRADGPQPQRARGRDIGRIALGPGHLRHAVRLRCAKAHRLSGRRFRNCRVAARRGQHRLHDLAIAGAPAEHAPQGVERLRLGRTRVAREQVGGGHQRAGCADSALRRAVCEERALEPIEPHRPRRAPRSWSPPGPRPDPARPGTRTPVCRREGRCRHRSRRRRSRSSSR